jgi:hypothetical protein
MTAKPRHTDVSAAAPLAERMAIVRIAWQRCVCSTNTSPGRSNAPTGHAARSSRMASWFGTSSFR